VLIPRPETERLVEVALAWMANRGSGAPVDIMDLGTGSGAIVAAIASEARAHRFFASDISSEAIAIARGNAEAAGVAGNVRFFVGDWLSAVRPGPIFDLILSNPPYVASGTWSDLQPEIVHYEPRLALDGDEDGLRSYRAIVGAAHRYLKPGGALMMEIGYAQREAVQILAEQSGAYDTYTCIQDYSGHDRVVAMHKKNIASNCEDC
jgi:release factor glutamine methyltransferase